MAQGGKEDNYREIITKAVCGKGSKYIETTHTIKPSHSPSSILGCWIINHMYHAEKKDDRAEVKGSYDINVWFSYESNTKTEVATEVITYSDDIDLTVKDEHILSDEMDIIARAVMQPTAKEATISEDGKTVEVQVERECLVECIGETKVAVAINPDGILPHFSEKPEAAKPQIEEGEYKKLDYYQEE